MARHGRAPRGRRPIACTERTRSGTGRSTARLGKTPRPCREAERHTPMMNEQGKSDRVIVPVKSPNRAGIQPVAEGMEGSALAKGNSSEQNTRRIQGRERVQNALGRVRQVAVREKKLKFTSLMH